GGAGPECHNRCLPVRVHRPRSLRNRCRQRDRQRRNRGPARARRRLACGCRGRHRRPLRHDGRARGSHSPRAGRTRLRTRAHHVLCSRRGAGPRMKAGTPRPRRLRTTASARLFSRALRILPGGVDSPVRAFKAVGAAPLFVRRASGAHLEDVDGNTFIDYVMSWGPLIHGHAPRGLVRSLAERAKLGTSYGAPNVLEVELGERVRRLMPSLERVRFVSSGTEAAMSVVRVARASTRRDKIIKFEGCYHGHADSFLVAADSGALTLGTP